MTDQQFYEEFPNLAYKQKIISFNVEEHNGNRWDDSTNYLSKEVIDLEEIKKHCLDKQKVREAIEEEISCDWNDDKHNSKQCNKCCLKRKLFGEEQ